MSRVVASLLLVVLLACSSGLQPISPSSFVRPERIAFACVRSTKAGDRVAVPLEFCSPCEGRTNDHALFAFVTQTARGELAAVDLKARVVIDTLATVPGFTFVPVGESPSGVVVPTVDPSLTFVASIGSSDLRVLDTHALLDASGNAQPTRAVLPIGRTGADGWQDAEPVDMVLTPDEQKLVLASPRLHALVVIDVAQLHQLAAREIEPEAVTQTIIELGTLQSDATVTVATGSDRYQVVCGGLPTPAPSQALPPRLVSSSSELPMPVALTVDRERNRVLVADSAQPFIHEIDLLTLSEVLDSGRPTFVTGAPTLDVAISPEVVAAPGDSVTERYVYAIDTENRDVLALNDRGVLQSVNAASSARVDRLDFGGIAASTIEVLEPGFRGCFANTSFAGPRYLEGVFLAAALTDGTIRVIDVYDARASERCTPTSSTAEGDCSASDPCAAIQRHRPRIGSVFVSKQPCIQPAFGTATGALSLTAQASATVTDEDTTTPPLFELDGCPGDKIPAFERVTNPGSTDPAQNACVGAVDGDDRVRAPLVCVNADPWAMGAETWIARWEGTLSRIGSGDWSDDPEDPSDDRTFTTDTTDLCAAGVLGADGGDADNAAFMLELGVAVADEDLRALYAASFDPPLSTTFDCDLFGAPRADGTNERLTFPIVNARFDALTLGEAEDIPEGFTAANVLAAARYCTAGMRFAFTIRSRNRYTVIGERSQYVHRVVRGADGTCELDETQDPRRTGQAIAGEVFENGSVRFGIAQLAGDNEPPRELTVSFAVTGKPTFVGMTTGSTSTFDTQATIVHELRYSPTDGRLYAVDSATRGLLPIPLNPLPNGLSTSSVFR